MKNYLGEALEETNLRIERVRFCTATNDVMTDEGKHYVTVFTQGEIPDGEVDRLQVSGKLSAQVHAVLYLFFQIIIIPS